MFEVTGSLLWTSEETSPWWSKHKGRVFWWAEIIDALNPLDTAQGVSLIAHLRPLPSSPFGRGESEWNGYVRFVFYLDGFRSTQIKSNWKEIFAERRLRKRTRLLQVIANDFINVTICVDLISQILYFLFVKQTSACCRNHESSIKTDERSACDSGQHKETLCSVFFYLLVLQPFTICHIKCITVFIICGDNNVVNTPDFQTW